MNEMIASVKAEVGRGRGGRAVTSRAQHVECSARGGAPNGPQLLGLQLDVLAA